MKVHSADIQKGMLTLNIEVPVDEQQPYLDRAARTISKEHPIAGFRPGNAPYSMVAAAVGTQAVLEHAAEEMVSRTYASAVKEGNYQVIGMPRVQIEMIAFGNPFIYSATAPLLPSVTVGSLDELKGKPKDVVVDGQEVEKLLQELREMQSTQTTVERAAERADRVVLDISMTLDKVPVEGGSTKGHTIDLNKPHYIPGLTEQLVGLSAGEKKIFTLPFPKEHYQRHLAGKNVDIAVEVNEVQQRVLPEADDRFAQKLGQNTITTLRELLKKNIRSEKEKKEQDRFEHELVKQLVEQSKCSDIPEILVAQEAHRMREELQDNVRRQGGMFDDYLASIKKIPEELLVEFAPQAVERVKAALLLRTIALEQGIKASTEEIDRDIAEASTRYQNDPEIQERIQTPELREYVATQLRNRKVIDWIKAQVKE